MSTQQFHPGILAFFLVPLLTATNAFAVSRVSLQDAYQAALSKTETAPIANSQEAQLKARIDQARGTILPQLSAIGQYTMYDPDGRSQTSKDYQSTARLNLTQVLFQPKLGAAYDAAKSSFAAQKQRTQSSRLQVFNDVAQRFYEVLLAESDVKNLGATLSLSNDRVREIKSRAKIGRSQTGDLLTAQSQLANTQASLEVAQGNLVSARDRFAFATGLPVDTPLDSDLNPAPAPQPMEYYLKKLEDHPDIKALQADVETARYQKKSAFDGHLPTLALSGNYYVMREGTTSGSASSGDWDVGATLTLPLFSGGTTQAQVREAREVETQSELLLRQRRRSGETDVKTAYHNLTTTLSQLKALESARDASEKNYREQTREYRYGLVTNLDVVQALDTLQVTRRAYDQSRIESVFSWAQLQAATGSDDPSAFNSNAGQPQGQGIRK